MSSGLLKLFSLPSPGPKYNKTLQRNISLTIQDYLFGKIIICKNAIKKKSFITWEIYRNAPGKD